MIGLFFHTYKDGEIHLQGQALDLTAPQRFLVQLFSWWNGEPDENMTFHINEMSDWTFYKTSIEMRADSRRQAQAWIKKPRESNLIRASRWIIAHSHRLV
jgi:hypothetical protein